MTRLSLNSASVSQEERTFEDSMDEIISTLQSLGSQRDRTSSIQTLKRVTELTQRIIARGSQDDVVWLPAMSKHLCRSLEVLTSFKLTGEFDVCKAALIMIEELASFVQRILQGTKAPAKDRFMKALVSFLVQHTGQLVSKASAHLESKCDIVLKSISICGTLCNLTDFNEGVKSLSAVCFNIAGVWYGRSQMEASLRLADFSIRLLQDYVTSTQLLDKDLNSLLSKRHDLLGLVYLSQEQVDKALEHFHTAMSLMSTEDWTRLADHNQHPFLTKAVPRYINTMFKYQKDNYAFISDTFCSELPQPQRTRIMELELRCLKLAHVQSDTSFWQITLNDNLLLLTPRSPEFALNRARYAISEDWKWLTD